jgi:hypothetical protein
VEEDTDFLKTPVARPPHYEQPPEPSLRIIEIELD